ncbi:GON-4-like protein isoform X2 [Salarias fasciatus]|uniref:GON-4-like protein isoform X2 n=1 Tax=Salarias fasciatus TaxID=181472 RepID=UPI0011765402|nr:GON-4-like protein isoform X2 [Salarias fasciatus]
MTSALKRCRLNTVALPRITGHNSAHSSAHSAPDHSHGAPLPQPAPEEEEEEEEEEEGYLLVEEDTTDSSLIITMEESQVKVRRRKGWRKRKRKAAEEEKQQEVGGASESEEEGGVEIDTQLDQSLETKSRQHNLTSVNVRNIIHEVITNEHVVAMMKAAMNHTEAAPPFEPKMTRSKLKEVVQRGAVVPPWSISPIKPSGDGNKLKPPQFVDIPLAEEDSSDEEYRPDEDDEDETAEDTFHESDLDSSTSSPRGRRLQRAEEDGRRPRQVTGSPETGSGLRPAAAMRVEDPDQLPLQAAGGTSRRSRPGRVSMGPPPPPKAPPPRAVTDSTFLEELHAVEEELAVCLEPYQPLPESAEDAGLMAYRTRSKRPLRDVPLGRLEAELRAPDITPDMYDCSSAHEDREWTDWLRGLMTSEVDQEEECDDEDDPEYNFLADVDEPDQEDYRDDKAVRITKKEVNELMEELFETLKEDLAGQEVDDEGHEEEEELQEETQSAQTHTAEHIAPCDDRPITELRTVRQQLQFIRSRRTHTPSGAAHLAEPHTLRLSAQQKTRLQRQLQQHVQLLVQIHLLTSPVVKLQGEAETTRQFLVELEVLAERAELLVSGTRPAFCSAFRASNLQGALRLLEELLRTPIEYRTRARPPDARGYVRDVPRAAGPAGLDLRHAARLPPPRAAAPRQPGPRAVLPPQDGCLHCSRGLPAGSRSQEHGRSV